MLSAKSYMYSVTSYSSLATTYVVVQILYVIANNIYVVHVDTHCGGARRRLRSNGPLFQEAAGLWSPSSRQFESDCLAVAQRPSPAHRKGLEDRVDHLVRA